MKLEKLRKTIEYGLYFLIFLLPWQTRWIWEIGEWEYLSKSLYATEILLGLIFLLSLIFFIKNCKLQIANCKFIFNFLTSWKKILKIISVFLFLCFLVFLSAILAINPLLAFYYLSKIAAAVVFIFLIKHFANLSKTAYVFVLGITIQAGLGIWQFLSQSSFASKWLGMAIQNASILGSSVVGTADGRWLRAYGAFPHPNIFAGYLVVAILLTAILYIRKEQPYLFPTLMILSTALFFTFSRAAWIALIISVLVYLFSNLKNKIKFKKIMPFSFVCLLVPIIFSFIYLPLFETRLNGNNNLEIKSTTERVELYRESVEIIKKHPFLGIGPGNYTLAVYNLINSERDYFSYQPVHNIYLLMIAEIGFLTSICFYLFIFLFFCWNKKKINLIILLPIVIIGLFDHYLISLYSGIMLSSLCLSLSSQNSKNIG